MLKKAGKLLVYAAKSWFVFEFYKNFTGIYPPAYVIVNMYVFTSAHVI